MTTPDSDRILDDDKLVSLERWLAGAIGAKVVRLANARRLAGGAVQENWRIDAEVQGGRRQGQHTWLIRTDAKATLSVSLDRAEEFECMRVAHEAGVLVPEPIACSDDTSVIGVTFSVQGLIQGIAQGRRIVRDPGLSDFGEALAESLGENLARLHGIAPPVDSIDFLKLPKPSPARSQVAQLRKALAECSDPRPASEYILSWLAENAPETEHICLVHGDFRTGNYMVQDGKLTGILDWEFCHWGDPYEDIGWFCAPCWRFGAQDRGAGGIASKDAILRGYNRVAESKLRVPRIAYWEILASVRWGIIAALQGDRYRTGGEQSLELALTGLMAPEMELDALDAIERYEREAKGR